MIDADSTREGSVVGFRFRGAVTNREFTTLAATIAGFEPMSDALIYFDWLGIDRWTFSAPTANDEAAWRMASKAIKRAVIVHDRRLNRQAAWLAAILRSEGVRVRSWRPQDAAAGATWLRMCTLPNIPDP